MSGSEQKIGGEVHNYRNEYKIKYGAKENARGEYQKEFTMRTDDDSDLSVQTFIRKLKLYQDGMVDAGFKSVKPKEFTSKKGE